MLKATSRTADLTFDGYTITITRHRSAFNIAKGTRTIPLQHISAVQWKKAGMMSGGYIRFIVAGSPEHRIRTNQALGTDILKDPNAIPFGSGQQAAFEAVKVAIEQGLAQGVPPQPQWPTQPTPAAAPQVDVADQIAKLADMHAKGILTDAEFAALKAKAIGP